MSWQCPCCGTLHDGMNPKAIIASLPLSKHERRFADCLVASFDSYLPRERVIRAIYINDPNGGPLYAGNVVSSLIPRLERKLKGCGLSIDSSRSYGIRLVWTVSLSRGGRDARLARQRRRYRETMTSSIAEQAS